jgi:hypothetical protein
MWIRYEIVSLISTTGIPFGCSMSPLAVMGDTRG